MCCGVVPILFGWFLSVPSLHVLVFLWKTFLDLYYYSGLDAHDCECRNGEHLGMSMNKAVVDSCLNCQVTHTI